MKPQEELTLVEKSTLYLLQIAKERDLPCAEDLIDRDELIEAISSDEKQKIIDFLYWDKHPSEATKALDRYLERTSKAELFESHLSFQAQDKLIIDTAKWYGFSEDTFVATEEQQALYQQLYL